MIYISGKITGTDNYLDKFHEAEIQLDRKDVINPAKVNAQLPKVSYDQYMEMAMCMLKMCNEIYMLKDWKDSNGAVLEYTYAKMHDYNIIFQK